MLRRLANAAISPFGLKIIPKQADQMHYQHDYGAGGMEAYRQEQIRANKEKLNWVWADERTLEVIAKDIEAHGLTNGICHGARNGFEVGWFNKRLNNHTMGTDISETASKFPNMVTHDFHEERPEWIGAWDFVYTNSLDQAFEPRKALATWADQLTADGRIYIEHTMQHSAAGASAMDPFGAHPMALPYLLFEWGKGHYRLADILQVEDVAKKGHVWVFVIERAQAGRQAHAPSLSSEK